jgi:hypothetical protein
MNTAFPTRTAAVISASCTLFGIAILGLRAAAGAPLETADALLNLVTWIEWSLLAWPIVFLARRWPLWCGSWKANALRHMGAALIFPLLHLAIFVTFKALRDSLSWEAVESLAAQRAPRHFVFGLILYGVISAIAQVADARRAEREQRQAAADGEAELTLLALESAASRVQPPFFLSSLADAERLLALDPVRGEAVLYRLADFLRLALDSWRKESSTLTGDLRLAAAQLAVESVRSDTPCRFRTTVDPLLRSLRLPPLFVPFLIESCIAVSDSLPRNIDLSVSRSAGEPLFRLRATDGWSPEANAAALATLDLAGVEIEIEREKGTEWLVVRCSAFSDTLHGEAAA